MQVATAPFFACLCCQQSEPPITSYSLYRRAYLALAFLSYDVAFSGYARPPQSPVTSPALVPLFSCFLLDRQLDHSSQDTLAGDHSLCLLALLSSYEYDTTLPLQLNTAVLGSGIRGHTGHHASMAAAHATGTNPLCSYVLVTLFIYLSGMAGYPRLYMYGYVTALPVSTSTAVSGRSSLTSAICRCSLVVIALSTTIKLKVCYRARR